MPVLDPPDDGLLAASAVWERIRARAEQRLLKVDLAVSACFERTLSAPEARDAHARCDELASWLGQLGLPQAAALARELRDCFATGSTGTRDAPHLASLCEDLRTLLAVTGAEVTASERPGDVVLVVGRDGAGVDTTLWVACAQGFRVAHITSWLPPERLLPACVYVALEDTAAAGRPMLRAAREHFPYCPIVATVEPLEIDDRLQLAPYADVLLPATTPPGDVMQQVRAVVARRSARSAIAVAGAVRHVAPALRDRMLPIIECDDAATVIAALRSGDAAAALLVDRRPGVDALEILRLVRTEALLVRAAVSVLVDESDPIRTSELLRAGADDVWSAPITEDELALRCRARLRRVADLATVHELDRPVASFSQAHASLLIERMLVAGLRRNRTVAIAVLHFADEVDEDRIGALAEPLAREFRREDIVGRFGHGFVVALQGVGRATAVRRFEGVLHRLDLPDGHCRIGVAEFPLDGQSLDELMAAAHDAIARADVLDGPLVVSPDWRPESEAVPDILVADADPTLRELLTSLLMRDGHRVADLDDGVAVFEHLTSARRGDLPKLLMMDLELTGMDGLQLLRRLRDAGVLSRVRVVVLTARIHEAELVQALELGAADVVTKPFSPALLLRRVTRVLTE